MQTHPTGNAAPNQQYKACTGRHATGRSLTRASAEFVVTARTPKVSALRLSSRTNRLRNGTKGTSGSSTWAATIRATSLLRPVRPARCE